MKNKNPKLIIISGPSGSGKTTTCNLIVANFPNIIYYKNQRTTRKPRLGEKGKGAYKSIPIKKFLQLKRQKKILMKTKFAGNYYWYTNNFIKDIEIAFNKNNSLVIDSIQPIKNWVKFKKQFPKIPIITIFLFSNKLELLKLRITKRANSSLKDINLRLKHAKDVLSESKFYDYNIDTSNFSNFKNKIFSIIKTHKL